MENKYEKLFSPGKINKLTLKNRIIFPPMAFSFNHTSGETSDKTIEAYARWARGGCAMLIPVQIFADPFEERPAWHRALPHKVAKYDRERAGARMHWAYAHWSEERNPRRYDMLDAVHANGALVCASLSPESFGWSQAYYNSHPTEQFETLGGLDHLTVGEIEAYVEEFANVSSWLKASGFDAIEIHFSVLPIYLLSPTFNKRKDKYGGDLDGRLQFTKELIQATREAVGKDFPLMFMLMMDADEEPKIIAKRVEEWGIDAFRARGGTFAKAELSTPSMYHPDGVHVELAAGVKRLLSIPVIAGSKLGNPDMAEKVLQEGKADFISIGRPLIADPDWPNKVRAGQADRVRKCIYCNIGCLGRVTMVPRKTSRCTVNPIFGNEEKFRDIAPAAKKKKVVIVGAGPAGMSAALTACQRGHEVVLFEKTGALGAGGHFKLATIPPFKAGILHIPEFYQKEFAELGNLKVHLNTEADTDRVMQERPDAVIIATGGRALLPELPGADNPAVITYDDVLLEKKAVGDHAVILGGGEVGCETALYLLKKGKRVTILEMCWRIADNLIENVRSSLMEELEKAEAEMIPGALVTAISGNRVNYMEDGKELKLEGDTIVLAMGAKPENHLYYDLSNKVLNLYLIGDAKEPRQIMEAVSEGFFAAYHL